MLSLFLVEKELSKEVKRMSVVLNRSSNQRFLSWADTRPGLLISPLFLSCLHTYWAPAFPQCPELLKLLETSFSDPVELAGGNSCSFFGERVKVSVTWSKLSQTSASCELCGDDFADSRVPAVQLEVGVVSIPRCFKGIPSD